MNGRMGVSGRVHNDGDRSSLYFVLDAGFGLRGSYFRLMEGKGGRGEGEGSRHFTIVSSTSSRARVEQENMIPSVGFYLASQLRV